MLAITPISPRTAADPDAPLLWRVEHAVGGAYLFGTIHVADPRVLSLPSAAEDALQEAEVVYTEIPLDAASRLGVAERSVLPGDRRLQDILPAETVDRANRYLAGIGPGFTIEPLARLKVWAIALTLQFLESRQEHPGDPLDVQIYARAADQGKEVGGLETVAEQLAVMDGLNLAGQIELLEGTLAYLERARARGIDVVGEVVDVYVDGDIEALGRKMSEYLSEQGDLSEPLLERLIVSRNHTMAERIDALLQSHPGRQFFFAIGAGHFWGDASLPQLLRQRGYTVRRGVGS